MEFSQNFDPGQNVPNFADGRPEPGAAPVAAPTVFNLSTGYSERHLGQFVPQIRDYLTIMTGETLDDRGDDEVVNTYLNRMRGYASGNSVRAGFELARLNQLSEDELSRVGEAYTIFRDMGGLFSEGTTWKETGSGLLDYGREILLDPVNLIGLGIGKAVSAGSTKVAAKVAQQTAMKAYKDRIAAGATQEIAERAARDVYAAAAKNTVAQEASELAARQATAQSATGLGRLTANQGTKEILTVMGFDALVSVGAELAYQEGMVITGVQEDYEWANAGLAALGVMAIGGVSLVARGMTGRSGNKILEKKEVNSTTMQPVLSKLTNTIETGDWFKKVAEGKELKDLDTEFWQKMLLGDKENGLKGLGEIMAEEGFTWQKRNADDKISNWIADVITQADPQDALKFLESFQRATGAKLSELSEATVKEFADNFAVKMRQGGITLNAASQLARLLKVPVDQVGKLTLEDYADAMLGLGIRKDKGWLESRLEVFGKGTERFQNNTIRMLVSNLATTALNIKGWAFASTLNTVSDIAIATLHGGVSGVKLLTGDVKGAAEAARVAGALAQANMQKFWNLMDPNTTYDAYRSITLVRPEAMRELRYVLPGGVEDVSKLRDDLGFDPNLTLFGKATDKLVDGIQKINLVTAQDVFTKSQEYLYQLDKNMRISFGQSLREVFSNSDQAARLMATKEFREVELKSIYETQRAIFSKSYKGKGFVGEVAGVIEDARNIPGVGLLVPFGRFFNNTIATMADASGVSFFARYAGFNKDRSELDLFTRGAIGWGLALSLVDNEREHRDRGLAWYEEEEAGGNVIDRRYDFPYSMFKAAARLMTYSAQGESVPEEERTQMLQLVDTWKKLSDLFDGPEREVPPELVKQMGKDVFGQLTRQLTDTTDSIGDLIVGVLTFETGWDDFGAFLSKTPIQFTNAWSRWLEPLNVTVGLARGTDFKTMDRKQGNELLNNSIRYIDQLVMAMTGNDKFPEQRYDAASGRPMLDTGKFVGQRTSGTLTSTEKVMNLLGTPHYLLNGYTPDPAADNRYNMLFNSLVEEKAKQVWDNPKFQNGTLEQQQFIWKKVLETTRANVLDVMRVGVNRSGDRTLALSFDISTAHGEAKIKKSIEELGMEGSLSDLTYDQLEILRGYLDTRDSILRIQTR
jgi:hypothetical protein